MKNLKIFILALVVFGGVSHVARATFQITEIMYDANGTDENHEWVEVQNTSPMPDDLSKWFFYSHNTKHVITPFNQYLVPPGSYAIVAQNAATFKSDWPNYQGLLFDSSWSSFNNKSDSIALKDPSASIVSSINFTASDGGAGNGDSLQLINGNWVGAHPTPGADNKASLVIPPLNSQMPAELSSSTANPAPTKQPVMKKPSAPSFVPTTSSTKEAPINLNDLGASAALPAQSNFPFVTSWLSWAGLAAVIIAGILIVWRAKNKIVNNSANREALSASDFTIVE